MFISHAQNFEDIVLWRAVGDGSSRVYVDVGAQDPVEDSVSLEFHRRGWRGVHVEPHPHFAARLRAARPGDVVIEAAVGSEPGHLAFHLVAQTGLSTGDPEIAAAHRASGWDVRVIEVPVITLDEVLAAAGSEEIAWLKIDVEGMETAVLQGWRGASRPWVVVLEVVDPLDVSRRRCDAAPLLGDLGYVRTLFDGLNDFFVRKDRPDIMARLDHGACLFDDAALGDGSSHPFRRIDLDRLAEMGRALEQERRNLEIERGELAAATQQIARLTSELENHRAALADARERVAFLEARIEAFLASASWRLTAPLRRLSAGARRLLAHPVTPTALRRLATGARRAVFRGPAIPCAHQLQARLLPAGSTPAPLADTLAFELESVLSRRSSAADNRS